MYQLLFIVNNYSIKKSVIFHHFLQAIEIVKLEFDCLCAYI